MIAILQLHQKGTQQSLIHNPKDDRDRPILEPFFQLGHLVEKVSNFNFAVFFEIKFKAYVYPAKVKILIIVLQ